MTMMIQFMIAEVVALVAVETDFHKQVVGVIVTSMMTAITTVTEDVKNRLQIHTIAAEIGITTERSTRRNISASTILEVEVVVEVEVGIELNGKKIWSVTVNVSDTGQRKEISIVVVVTMRSADIVKISIKLYSNKHRRRHKVNPEYENGESDTIFLNPIARKN